MLGTDDLRVKSTYGGRVGAFSVLSPLSKAGLVAAGQANGIALLFDERLVPVAEVPGRRGCGITACALSAATGTVLFVGSSDGQLSRVHFHDQQTTCEEITLGDAGQAVACLVRQGQADVFAAGCGR